ncbi:PQQ-dependent sugar dehydrogenase [Geoalkalibacter sp.]|uniref:PQQ-dependent sugar dehydrogenase n=1 Tax=Geoalkalibacter sp. TaxID=3041440 RepID=UPI00272E8344|nr:PQQ-dependent sugar dehydrogenase [Geoalkalibacter sp.]
MLRALLALAASLLPLAILACGGGGGGSASKDPLPPSSLTLSFTPVAEGLSRPTVITHAADGSGRLFLVEQSGTIRILRDGGLLGAPFLQIADRLVSGGEQGLLGLAFPPGFSQKGYFYVNYTRAGDGATVVSRFFVSADPDVAQPDSEQILLTLAQPFANHNGGQLAFGPDGFLYVGVGDGGSGGDPLGNGQDLSSLLGKLLRLDVEAGVFPYAVPSGNPFVSVPGARDEIWASGLRNPWRFSFDRLRGDLFVADVGQSRWEEINFAQAGTAGGANYGWNVLEGPDCFSPAVGCTEPPDYLPPVAFYGRELGVSVTGGYVYRGPDNPGLQGFYVYGDFGSGRIWGLSRAGGVWANELLAETDLNISTFGEDESGRLYLADYSGGRVYRIDEQ